MADVVSTTTYNPDVDYETSFIQGSTVTQPNTYYETCIIWLTIIYI